jgi:hypothetical protein
MARAPYGARACRRQTLDERRKEAIKQTRWAYEYGRANSYTYAALQAVLLLDEELEKLKPALDKVLAAETSDQ